jgi:uncharacterized membrane protein
MLVSFFFFGAGSVGGVVASKVRHNMLTGMLLFAVAHLLVNGDLASIILFGGLGLWSVLSMVLISRAGPWDRPAPGPLTNDLKAVVGALVLGGISVGVKIWMGYNVFLGTYP